jgi:hypothetical protein
MPASYTTQTKQLYVLTDVVNSIGTLQTAAENAVPQNILPLKTARTIVSFCVAANTTIGQTPNGWYAVVNAAYASMKSQLTPDELMKFSGAFSAFELVLNSFSGAK